MEGCYDRFAALARVINVADENTGDKEAAKAFLEELVKLCKTCDIPTLEEYGIKKQEFDSAVEKMAQDAMEVHQTL